MNSARVNYFSALYNYNTSKAALDSAMGVPVDVDSALYYEEELKSNSVRKAREAGEIRPGTVIESPIRYEDGTPAPAVPGLDEAQPVPSETVELVNAVPEKVDKQSVEDELAR